MRIVAVIVAVGLAAGIIWFDQGSLERGNRLYRDGDPPAAVEVYERVPSAEYHLGTALLGIDADSLKYYFVLRQNLKMVLQLSGVTTILDTAYSL